MYISIYVPCLSHHCLVGWTSTTLGAASGEIPFEKCTLTAIPNVLKSYQLSCPHNWNWQDQGMENPQQRFQALNDEWNSAALSKFSNPGASLAMTYASRSIGVGGFYDSDPISKSDCGDNRGHSSPNSHSLYFAPPARFACIFCDQKAFFDKHTWRKHEERFHESLWPGIA